MGVLYILVSGACFGLLPWFARIAYGHGADPFGMLAARFTIAAAMLLAARAFRLRTTEWPGPRRMLHLVLLGAAGYAPQSTFFFNGIRRIDVSLATVIFYTYPVLVVLASWLVFRHRPSRAMTACLVVAVAGAALTAGQVGSGSLSGVLFMLAAACWYTGFIIVSTKIVAGIDAMLAMTFVMIGASAAHVIVLLTKGADLPHDTVGWSAAAAAAFFSTIIAMGFFFAGVKIIGPGEAAVLSTIEPVVSIVVGVTALGESLGAVRVAGAVMVLASVAVLSQLSGRDPTVQVTEPH